MFHPGTQTFIDDWAVLPRSGPLPARADWSPLAFGRLVPQLFSADRMAEDARLRVAGGWIETLHGRPLRGVSWPTLWAPQSRPLVTAALTQTVREARPVVIVAEAARLRGTLEIVIAPLRAPGGTTERLIGLYQPIVEQERRREAIGALTARLSIGVGSPSRPPLTLASLDGRRIA